MSLLKKWRLLPNLGEKLGNVVTIFVSLQNLYTKICQKKTFFLRFLTSFRHFGTRKYLLKQSLSLTKKIIFAQSRVKIYFTFFGQKNFWTKKVLSQSISSRVCSIPVGLWTQPLFSQQRFSIFLAKKSKIIISLISRKWRKKVGNIEKKMLVLNINSLFLGRSNSANEKASISKNVTWPTEYALSIKKLILCLFLNFLQKKM